jgi:hypothetical protein
MSLAIVLLSAGACAHPGASASGSGGMETPSTVGAGVNMSPTPPSPDPRVGLKAGLFDAGQASWNMHLVSNSPPSKDFVDKTNSDLAFDGKYVIQGSYNGFQIWDISNPSKPTLRIGYVCPASQSDVSIYKNLLFVSGEGLSGRLDCSGEGVKDTVSNARLRGIRIFDISDLDHPKNVGNVQTCRGSHTHTLLVDPHDQDNVYIYVSGSSTVRSATELPGCVKAAPSQDPNSALFRIEVIKVPLAHPEQAAIVSSPRIFNDLLAPPTHGAAKEDLSAMEAQRAKGAFMAKAFGDDIVVGSRFVDPKLDSIVKARGGTGPATHADSEALRPLVQGMIDKMIGDREHKNAAGQKLGPTQCHDITVYPALGLAGGACEGYGMLLDIHDPEHPTRLAAAADSNFSYWHSATFNNDGTKLLFSDEWGGGGQPKCRATDKKEWGADAIYAIVDGKLQFLSYYKMPAAQTKFENCVAHNGSLIPIPGRDVMVQAWYQGGLSVFDWTDGSHPKEIAFFDRGPIDSTKMVSGGSWSAYWYNGVIVSSEIARGLDVFELTPSAFLSKNEIDAAKSVDFDQFNTQGQPKLVWPASFALSGAYLDQLARSKGLAGDRITAARKALAGAENASGSARKDALTQLATQLDTDAGGAKDGAKTRMLAASVRDLASKS